MFFVCDTLYWGLYKLILKIWPYAADPQINTNPAHSDNNNTPAVISELNQNKTEANQNITLELCNVNKLQIEQQAICDTPHGIKSGEKEDMFLSPDSVKQSASHKATGFIKKQNARHVSPSKHKE